MSATWKAAERRIAAQLGGTRVPVSGRARGDAPDIRVPGSPWSIEVKHTSTPYERIEDALRQAEAAADAGQMPVAIFHRKGGRYPDSLVVCRLRDFVDWYGSPEDSGATPTGQQPLATTNKETQ